MLKVSMIGETELIFAKVLKDDLSLTNFVDSDFTMFNAWFANHYEGITRFQMFVTVGALKNVTDTRNVLAGLWK